MTLKKKPFENIVGNGENAGKQNLSFSHNFLYSSIYKIHFLTHIILSIANAFDLRSLKFCPLLKGLTHYKTTKF